MAEITDPGTLAQLNTSGPDFLKQAADTHGPGYAALVQATAEGRSPAPSGMSLRTPFGQQLTQDVYQFDPTADSVNLPARVAARKAFMDGAQGKASLAAATALEHSSKLDDAITNLGNVNPGFGLTHIVNGVRNAARDASGNEDVTQFQNTVTPLVDELERAYTGTGGSVSAINDLRQGINLSQSMGQQRKAVQTFAGLLAGKLDEQSKAYNLAMGTTGQTAPGISSRAQQLLTAYQDPKYLSGGLAAVLGPDGGAPPSVGGGSTPPTNGGNPPPAPPPAPGGAGPQTLATGDTHTTIDAQKSAQLEQLIRSGAPIDQIQQIAPGTDPAQVASVRSYLKTHPDYSGFAQVTQTAPTTLLNRVASSAPAAAVAGAADAATFGLGNKVAAGATAVGDRIAGDNRSLGDIYSGNLARAEIGSDALASAHPIANLAGETAGFIGGDAILGRGIKAGIDALPASVQALGARAPASVIAGLKTAAPALQDGAYGAAYGAGSSDNLADAPGAALKGAGMAALGGVLGRGLTRGAAAIVSPVANDAVRRLTDAGVTLTPGQILGAGGGVVGKVVKGIEDLAAGFPIVGDIINNARRGGVEDFNKAAINDALAPIGGAASDIGHAGVADARSQISDAYTQAIGKMSAVPDAQLTTDLQAVGSKIQTLSPAHREQFNNIVDTDLQPYLNGKSKLDGNDLQAIKEGLDSRIGNLKGQGSSPQDRDLADRLGDVRDSIMSLAGRTPGSDTSDFQNADRAYAMLSRVEGAAAKSKDGVFSPNQFQQAVTKRGYGTTTASVAGGRANMQDLAKAASTVLPSSVPDSGTSGRAALGLIAGKLATGGGGAALGGAAGYEQGGLAGALTGAGVGALAFSRLGLRATQTLLAGSRGKTLNTLGDLLRRNAALGGAAGTPLLLQPGARNGN